MTSTLAVIGSNDLTAPYLAEAGKMLGFTVEFILEEGRHRGTAGDALEALKIRWVPHLGRQEAEQFVRSLKDVHGVLSLADAYVEVAACIAARFGMAGLTPAVAALGNKGAVARLLPELGPPSTEFRTPASQAERHAVMSLRRDHDAVLIKPTRGSGAAGHVVLDRSQESDVLDHLPSGHWIAQAVRDPSSWELFSAELYCLNGRTHVLGVTDRRKYGRTETGAAFPTTHPIGPRLAEYAEVAVDTLIERLRLSAEDAAFWCHAEFLVDTAAPSFRAELIDLNPGRIGGGPMIEQIGLSLGVSGEYIAAHFVELTTGRDPARLPPARLCTSSVLYGTAERCGVQSVELPLNPGVRHKTLVSSGDEVGPLGRDNWSWIGILSGLRGGPERAAAEAIICTTDGRTVKPVY